MIILYIIVLLCLSLFIGLQHGDPWWRVAVPAIAVITWTSIFLWRRASH